jgi:hypothetical protein
VERHVEQLLERLPGFLEACQEFSSSAQQVNSSRQQMSLALSRHSQLLEVLEIPQVVDTCVRNGYYEEALDLCSHVRHMERKHTHIPIVKGIWEDVERSMRLMQSQLLASLRASIQLPACLRAVGFLRRMECFSPAELRLRFLQARDAWLTSVLSAIPRDDPYHHLTRTIEVSRVHLFDILTQYRAIFPDDDSAYHSSLTTPTHVDGALFYTWLGSKVNEFLKVLEWDLGRGVSGRTDSLLSQSMYFGLSFSRIGADFRPLIVPVFVRMTVNVYQRALRSAKHCFHESMKQLSLASLTRTTSSLAPPPSLGPSLTPPTCLLDHPPLAGLTNGILGGLNEVRQCAPVAVGRELARETRRLLDSTVHDIAELHRRGGGPLTSEEEMSFQQLVRVTVHHFLPFIAKCFSSLFTKPTLTNLTLTTPLSSHLTPPLSSHTSLEWEELDVAAIATPLQPLCPEVFAELEQMAHDNVTAILDHVTEVDDHVIDAEDHVTNTEDHVTNKESGPSTGGGNDTADIRNTTDRVTTPDSHVTGDDVTDLTTPPPPSPQQPLALKLTATDTTTA